MIRSCFLFCALVYDIGNKKQHDVVVTCREKRQQPPRPRRPGHGGADARALAGGATSAMIPIQSGAGLQVGTNSDGHTSGDMSMSPAMGTRGGGLKPEGRGQRSGQFKIRN